MDILDEFIAAVGVNVIIFGGIGIVVFIIAIFTYRYIKLRGYRKDLVELENQMNAVKTMPIQYRLGRVKAISNNMPSLAGKYEEYSAEFERLNKMQTDEITLLITEVDDLLFARKLKGVKKQLEAIQAKNDVYEKESKELLEHIEKITEIENIQRIEIIRIKERYRDIQDQFAGVRFKIEDFVPAINEGFEKMNQRFVALEELMNNQQFNDASEAVLKMEKDIEHLENNVRDLPTYVSIVRKYIPKKLEDIKRTMAEMAEKGFSLDVLKATTRLQKITGELELTTKQIKSLSLLNVGQNIEIMTEDINRLIADFEREEIAFSEYQLKKEECYSHIGQLDIGLKEAVMAYEELKENYIIEDLRVDIVKEQNKFQKVIAELTELTTIIDSRLFSYTDMINRFNELLDKCKPFETELAVFTEIKDTLRLQEKRALDELDNINIVLLEIKSEIKNKHLPMINESYKDYIDDSYKKAEEILHFTKQRPMDLERLSSQVDVARDVIYKLYDNVHNLIVTAEMVEDAIVFGNRYRSSFLEVNTELTKAELLFRNGEYTKALGIAVDIIEKIKPGSYEMLVNKNNKKV